MVGGDHHLQVIVVVAMVVAVAAAAVVVEDLEFHAIQSIEVILCSSMVKNDLIFVFKMK